MDIGLIKLTKEEHETVLKAAELISNSDVQCSCDALKRVVKSTNLVRLYTQFYHDMPDLFAWPGLPIIQWDGSGSDTKGVKKEYRDHRVMLLLFFAEVCK